MTMTPHGYGYCYSWFLTTAALVLALTFALGAAAAAPVQTSALCAIAKWEDVYIDEWLDYHLGLGIDRIYVYDNSEDFTMRNKSRPDSVELVHFTASDPGGKRQRPAYTDCITTRGTAHTWVGFIDIDEFLVLKRHACVNDFLAEHLTQVHRLFVVVAATHCQRPTPIESLHSCRTSPRTPHTPHIILPPTPCRAPSLSTGSTSARRGVRRTSRCR